MKYPKHALKAQYVIVSSTIRRNRKYEKNVVAAPNLYPEQQLLLDYDNYKDENYRDGYFEKLSERENKTLLATFIKYSIEEKATIIFLCGHKEKKYRYLNYIKDFIESEFGYKVYDYKKTGLVKDTKNNDEYALKKCEQVIKYAKDSEMARMMRTESGRKQYAKSLKKSELKKKLKASGLYYKGMDKSEMIESFQVFM